MVFAEAIRAEVVTKDPTANIRLPKSPTKPFRVIEAGAEEQALLTAAQEHGLLLPVLLAMDGGLRWQEVYGLHTSNVNTVKRRIDVSDVLGRSDFEPRPYPKGKLTRSVPATALLTKALADDAGVYVGVDVVTGSPFCFDPWALYAAGSLTNPNVLLAGVIGQGKSALAKALAVRSTAAGRRAYVPGAPKGSGPPSPRRSETSCPCWSEETGLWKLADSSHVVRHEFHEQELRWIRAALAGA